MECGTLYAYGINRLLCSRNCGKYWSKVQKTLAIDGQADDVTSVETDVDVHHMYSEKGTMD